ncbi:hypothetical protein EVG20_g595 [Dentipellis fragilis]|uniref:ATP-grasp domain-containing protein n=1 Tax=Dentipellis fragilis TaxID=205917 RepID=A0A4Y9ZCA7_9AGAM|nr:hypothetical protein EVG20_g595 [Dentipellis fragilis]
MPLRILLLGSGGREHALGWKLEQSKLVDHIFVCPGNGGTASGSRVSNVSDVSASDFGALVQWAVSNKVRLPNSAVALERNTLLDQPRAAGPEQPLVDGVETHFRKAAFRIFSSSQYEEAVKYVRTCGHKIVLKASGLAAGKGVLIPETVEEAIAGLEEIMVKNVFGSAGSEVVVEELLTGPELSVLAFSDGYTVIPLPAAQDHKRIGEGDTGLNTGGMGVYAPAPIATPAVMEQIMQQSLQPTIDGMRKEGFPFVGLLFTGFMLTESGPKVLEYNVRFGDPETEALMLLLSEDTDLAAVLLACVEHRLDSVSIKTRPGFAVSVVLASGGYPGSYAKGKEITVGKVPSNVVVFHAGTTKDTNVVKTSGGRVIAVSAYAPTLREALDAAYAGVNEVNFEGKVFRRDIAHRALTSGASAPGLTYAQAGVSVDAGNSLVEAIKPYVRATRRSGADAEIGGFGGVFDLKATGYKDPVLVSGTDGVGTKLRVAVDVGIHDLVGIDLVAMSVNDLIVQGAEPLYFLDYYGCSRLDVPVATQVVKGIATGCQQAGCALIGGETAEMPGMYQEGDYDLAGFAVGAVERHQILPKNNIQAGDVLLGVPSSGLHSNGFSLVRKVIAVSGLSYSSPCPWDSSITLGRALLEPTQIYIKTLLPAVKADLLKGMSHITGGGFIENIPRVLPKGLGCYVDAATWELPPVFRFLMQHGGIEPLEMARTFNNGIGMVLVVAPANVDKVVESLSRAGQAKVFRIGEITTEAGVQMRNVETWKA